MLLGSISTQSNIEHFLAGRGTFFRFLDKGEAERVCEKWLKAFALKGLKEKGSPVFNGYMWHGLSFEIEESIVADASLQAAWLNSTH